MAPAGLWIDTDIALGAAKGDVDDGWAMAAVLRGPRDLRRIARASELGRHGTSMCILHAPRSSG